VGAFANKVVWFDPTRAAQQAISKNGSLPAQSLPLGAILDRLVRSASESKVDTPSRFIDGTEYGGNLPCGLKSQLCHGLIGDLTTAAR
jgi:hypothetical protein